LQAGGVWFFCDLDVPRYLKIRQLFWSGCCNDYQFLLLSDQRETPPCHAAGVDNAERPLFLLFRRLRGCGLLSNPAQPGRGLNAAII
jgi:hypothetical protein